MTIDDKGNRIGDYRRLRRKSSSPMIDTENRDDPICPHCGYIIIMPQIMVAVAERSDVLRCHVCSGKFQVNRNVTVTYTTQKLEPKPEQPDIETQSKSPMEIAKSLEKTMRCNCDLDNWEPEKTTGHSWVCRIHIAAMNPNDPK
jgi:hypothetical protein